MDRKNLFRKLIFISCIICLMTGCHKDNQSSSTELSIVETSSEQLLDEDSNQENQDINSQTEQENTVIDNKNKEENQGGQNITVYICGQINNPGVYKLPENSRIYDLIILAGGFADGAMEIYLNQAEIVTDGEKIYVPTIEEVESGRISGVVSGLEEEGEVRININTATKEQLMLITGIGEAKADSIIQYREEQGAFLSPEDIQNIDGIKSGMYEKLKDEITV